MVVAGAYACHGRGPRQGAARHHYGPEQGGRRGTATRTPRHTAVAAHSHGYDTRTWPERGRSGDGQYAGWIYHHVLILVCLCGCFVWCAARLQQELQLHRDQLLANLRRQVQVNRGHTPSLTPSRLSLRRAGAHLSTSCSDQSGSEHWGVHSMRRSWTVCWASCVTSSGQNTRHSRPGEHTHTQRQSLPYTMLTTRCMNQ